jgi:hypothetical protein
MDRLERRAEQMREEFEAEVARVRQSFRFDIVPYEPPERALMPRTADAIRIKVRRPEA